MEQTKMTGTTKIVKTPEEKKEEKRIYMKEYMKTYMKNRRSTDPEFLEKQREYKRNNEKKKYETDPEYRKKKGDEYKLRYAKYREAYINTLEKTEK